MTFVTATISIAAGLAVASFSTAAKGQQATVLLDSRTGDVLVREGLADNPTRYIANMCDPIDAKTELSDAAAGALYRTTGLKPEALSDYCALEDTKARQAFRHDYQRNGGAAKPQTLVSGR